MHLVTGGAGFIGSHLVEALLKEGKRVRVVDNFSSGRVENLRPFLKDIELLTGDVSDESAARAAAKGVEVVFHQAALPSVPRSIQQPVASHQANATGTLQMLQAATQAGVRRFVYAASSSAYGDTPTLPKIETMPPRPRSPYVAAKLTGELYCQSYYHVHGLETVCLRYFNIFGPRQDPESPYAAVIPRFLEALLSGHSPVIFGDGNQTRDFTFIENAVQANLRAAEAEGVGGEVFNVACGKRVSLNHLLEMLQVETGVRISATFGEPRPGDVRDSLASIDKARERLGYRPSIDVKEGIARTVAWFTQTTGLRRAA